MTKRVLILAVRESPIFDVVVDDEGDDGDEDVVDD
jgi:hypothetical protein